MNPASTPQLDDLFIFECDCTSGFPMTTLAELSGVPVDRIEYYLDHGLIVPGASVGADAEAFDLYALRTLRRIEHLRTTCDFNLAGLKLVQQLLTEIDRLHDELRRRPPAG